MLASALRRSELAALTVADLDFVAEGVKLSLARSKTDQEAAGQIVGVVATGTPTCPVAALRTWLEAAASPMARCSARSIVMAGSPRACPTGPSR